MTRLALSVILVKCLTPDSWHVTCHGSRDMIASSIETALITVAAALQQAVGNRLMTDRYISNALGRYHIITTCVLKCFTNL